MPSAALIWGSTAAERRSAFGCDELIPDAGQEMFRGVSAAAPAATLFRWLCQLRHDPYSYDWIDNWGRRSPSRLTPGLEHLEVGQRFMGIFELVSFAAEREITLLLTKTRLFGDFAVSYRVDAVDDGHSRLVAKIRVAYPRGLYGWLLARTLPWGDLVMMRRQLLNLARLAEGSPT
ncbi:MAG: hypothetical protein AAF604_07895 [Acidobacteriota bacterium]